MGLEWTNVWRPKGLAGWVEGAWRGLGWRWTGPGGCPARGTARGLKGALVEAARFAASWPAEWKKKGFPDRESNPGRGGESAES